MARWKASIYRQYSGINPIFPVLHPTGRRTGLILGEFLEQFPVLRKYVGT